MPLVSATYIKKMGFKYSYSDNIPKLALCKPLIVNTDDEFGPGVHWLTVFRYSPKRVFIYDPLGPNNMRVDADGNPSSEKMIHSIRNSNPKISQFSYFKYKSQMPDNHLCGYYALLVAKHLKEYKPRSAGAINNIIVSLFGKSADLGDVRRLLEEF